MLRLTSRPSLDTRTILVVVALALLAAVAATVLLRGRGDETEEAADETLDTVPMMGDGMEIDEDTNTDDEKPVLAGNVPVVFPTKDLQEAMQGTSQARLSEIREEWSHSEEALHLAVGELAASGEAKVFPIGDVVKVSPAE